jgi:hypothetical protein
VGVEAVSREPVSARNSLVAGKYAGNLRISHLFSALACRFSRKVKYLRLEFPSHPSRELFEGHQGNNPGDQGI